MGRSGERHGPAQTGLRLGPVHGARERYVAAFMLGLALLFPPLLVIFDYPGLVGGIPMLFLYLYTAWLLLILVIVLIATLAPHEESESRSSQDGPGPVR